MTAPRHRGPPFEAARTDLAREFRATPYGIHSPALQVLLNRMRSLPMEGKHLLVMTRPHEEWTLAEMRGQPPRPRLLPAHVFTRVEDAEWFVFKLRWERLFGRPLALDDEAGR